LGNETCFSKSHGNVKTEEAKTTSFTRHIRNDDPLKSQGRKG